MNKIRVLVANRPRLMRDLIMATVADQPDIEVVGELQQDADIVPMVEQRRPDVLIIALDKAGERPSICDFVLERYPHLKILAVAPEKNTSVFYWAQLDICANPIEASEAGVLSALRGKPYRTGREN